MIDITAVRLAPRARIVDTHQDADRRDDEDHDRQHHQHQPRGADEIFDEPRHHPRRGDRLGDVVFALIHGRVEHQRAKLVVAENEDRRHFTLRLGQRFMGMGVIVFMIVVRMIVLVLVGSLVFMLMFVGMFVIGRLVLVGMIVFFVFTVVVFRRMIVLFLR